MTAIRSLEYNDVEQMKQVLVGRRIVSTKATDLDTYRGQIEFTLDDGHVFVAEEADGGCACSNGCFNVANPETTDQVITDVQFVEEPESPVTDYLATLRLFVYADQIKTELVRSQGTDNGYYGWGYHVTVREAA